MAPSLPTESIAPGLDRDGQRQLLALAREAITAGGRDDPRIDLAALPPALQQERAVFVTLTLNGSLRGCIGSLVATAPLALATADAARSAAYRDPRFPPVQSEELTAIRIEIAVLSELAPIAVDSRRALLADLRPGVDGLLLEDGPCRSTFLPKVWGQLPEPREFVAQLLSKAGLPPDHWSDTLRAHRYTVSNFAESDSRGSA